MPYPRQVQPSRVPHSSLMDHFPSHNNICKSAINQQIIDLVGHLDTPCGDAEGGILNSLELNY